MSTLPPDDILTLLRQDHEVVTKRFSELSAAGVEQRAGLFWKLTDELVRHEVAEEVVVYPVIRQHPDGAALADSCIHEQAAAEQRLAGMEKLDPTSSEFMVELLTLRTAVQQHATQEEVEVFPLLAKLSSETLVSLGENYTAAKAAAPNHPHPNAPDAPPGNTFVGPIVAMIDRIRDAAARV